MTARVLAQGTRSAEYLPSQPDVPAGTTLFSLTLDIETAEQARADVAMGPATGVIEALSRSPAAPNLVGRRIDAVVTLVGTTRASRWLISDIRVLRN